MATGLEAATNSTAKPFVEPSLRKTDCIALRFELEDNHPLPKCARELSYNTDMQAELSDAAALDTETKAHIAGRRAPHDIKIETYSPKETSDMTYARAAGAIGSKVHPDSPTPKPELIAFFSGIPAVECIRGTLHLYKQNSPIPCESEVVCVLCIPAHQQLTDMLSFLSPVISGIGRLRVIRDSTPNQYMLLISFKNSALAREFSRTYSGRSYNSMEKTVCQVVSVVRVEIKKSCEGGALFVPGMTELPACPVCLERLDDSILTILCNHSFHTQCLTRWEDSTCPVCRYTQTPEPSGDNTCFSCDSKEDLWICLICGNIGCGRYVGRHAHNHFVETQHTFSMQLGTQRVWDYIGDNYVHRLVQNKGDGKLVEVTGQTDTPTNDEKIDSLQLEYTYLLTSQLESQRLFFEEKIAMVEKDMTDKLSVMEHRCRVAVSSKQEMDDKMEELEKEKKSLEKKTTQQQTKLNKLTSQLKEEKELNKCLSENQKLWKDRVGILEAKIDNTIEQKEVEMRELQEQVRDLMFYLETQKKVAASSDDTRQEIQEGQVVVTQSPSAGAIGGSSSSSSSSSARRTRKKKGGGGG